jgi:hypothetical protein
MGTVVGVPQAAQIWPPDPGAIVTGAIPIAPDDDLVVTTWAQTAGGAVALTVRVLTPGGPVSRVSFYYTVAAGVPAASKRFSLPPGFLLDVSVTSDTAALRRGDLFVQIALEPSTSGTDVLARHTVLIQDYLEVGRHLAWPGSPIRSSLDGAFKQLITGTSTPGAGAEIIVTIATCLRVNLKVVWYTLTTAVAAATRRSHLIIDNGATVALDLPSNTTQIASLAYTYYWAMYAYSIGLIGTNVYNPLPAGIILDPGWRLRTVTDSIQGADQYTAAVYGTEFMTQQ